MGVSFEVFFKALSKALQENWRTLLKNYVQIPIGIVFLLIPCFSLHLGLHLLPWSYELPSSIICMLLLFFLLLFLHKVSPERVFRAFNAALQPSCEWSLEHVGIFMTPCFITLPLRTTLSSLEIGMLCAWFLPPLLVTWAINIILCKLITLAIPIRSQEVNSLHRQFSHSTNNSQTNLIAYSDSSYWQEVRIQEKRGSDLESLVIDAEVDTSSFLDEDNRADLPEEKVRRESCPDQVEPSLRLLRQWSQISRRNDQVMTHWMEDDEKLPSSQFPYQKAMIQKNKTITKPQPIVLQMPRNPENSSPRLGESNKYYEPRKTGFSNPLSPPGSMNFDLSGRTPDGMQPRSLTSDGSLVKVDMPPATPITQLSNQIARSFDLAIYTVLLIVGLILYYAPGGSRSRTVVFFMGLIAVIWILSKTLIPHSWTHVLHPTLVTSLVSSVVIIGIGSTAGQSMKETLEVFSKEVIYLDFLNPLEISKTSGTIGAGDILESVLDASTVALAYLLFEYRQYIYFQGFRIFLLVVPNCSLALLFWPVITNFLPILPAQALTFTGRSMSSPLALELLKILEANRSLGVVMVYLTAVTVTILRGPMFHLFRVKTDGSKTPRDSFIMGATVGVMGGIIGTSSLIKRHSQAAGTSTVTLIMYLTMMLSIAGLPFVRSFIFSVTGHGSKKEAH